MFNSIGMGSNLIIEWRYFKQSFDEQTSDRGSSSLNNNKKKETACGNSPQDSLQVACIGPKLNS